jgi:hypothetical protein
MRSSLYALSLATLAALQAGLASAGESTVKGGSNLSYKYDDNIRVTPSNQVTLSGVTVDAYVDANYKTPRLEASTYLKFGIERYENVDLDTDNPNLEQPETSDFDNESLDFKADVAYDWEHHTLSLYGRYWEDSTLNTQFQDTGLGGLREIEGATKRTTYIARPAWQWQLTERQLLDTTLQYQTVDYESAFYVDYDYASIVSNWSYVLNERLRLQIQPYFSLYENDADVLQITSDTLGLQFGAIWAVTEKWQLNGLVGSALVNTEFDGPGSQVFDFDYFLETGEVRFTKREDQEDTSFIGDVTLAFDEEVYGFSANASSQILPSGDGILRKNYEARLKYYWKPRERLRLDIDTRISRSDTTGGRVDDARDFAEAGIRLGYQFAEHWWLSARYRYREQDYERNNEGKGDGNTIEASVSYRLPKEIL